MKRQLIASLLALVIALPAAAQQYLSIGSLFDSGSNTLVTEPNVTFVDLSSPATADGTVNSATVRWQVFPNQVCAGSFFIRLYRPTFSLPGAFQHVATRGPFDSKNGTFTVPLAPLEVKAGDFLGISQTRASSECGGVQMTSGSGRLQSAYFKRSDTNGFDLRESTLRRGNVPSVRASVNGLVLEGTLAGAGSAAGSGGSYFRTSLQLSNADTTNTITIKGSIVFHPAGKAVAPSDPRMTFEIPPGRSLFYEDVVNAMGQAGLGSIDILTQSSPAPYVSARVFNDQGAAGTYGFSEDFVPPLFTLQFSDIGHAAIADPASFRTNVGIRTLAPDTVINFQYRSREGAVLGNVNRTYATEFFEQIPLSAIFPGVTLTAGRLTVRPSTGSTIVYVSTTDNRTNDSNVEIVKAP
jgi:hypothetical protein